MQVLIYTQHGAWHLNRDIGEAFYQVKLSKGEDVSWYQLWLRTTT